MAYLESMRTELWHPMLVHLPLAALMMASAAGLLASCLARGRREFADRLAAVLLVAGLAGGWLAVYTGQLAYTIEVRKICDPGMLQEHQWWSYAAMFGYSAVAALVLLGHYVPAAKGITRIFATLLYAACLAAMAYAGHLGAKVVYEQGAAVHKPKEDCSDYIVN